MTNIDLSESDAVSAIDALLASHPSLGWWGIDVPEGVKRHDLAQSRVSLRACWREFVIACKYADLLSPRNSINRSHNSYGLKHRAEQLCGDGNLGGYVGNGAMIAAMLYKGFKYESLKNEFGYAYFNISSKNVPSAF